MQRWACDEPKSTSNTVFFGEILEFWYTIFQSNVMKRLVVVESPTKARTIRKFLPKDYVVEASMGHVRDLPASASQIPAEMKKQKWSRLGINVEDDFAPLYIVPSDKKKVVTGLKKALKDVDELFIATDEDREGESIGWHLINVLKAKVPIRRMVFHEITEEAILNALENTRDIDYNLVDAQETRRILDRLVGYSLSPLLWKKVKPKLSAGRVQSVAVRLCVMRERERIAFIPAGYWDLKAQLEHGSQGFEATMTHLNDVRLATGKDFDDDTGQLKEGLKLGENIHILAEKQATELTDSFLKRPWTVTSIEERKQKRTPFAPFITSTLQQEGSRKLGLSARQTMQVAQKLYEQGYITYMRTDSTTLSGEAIDASRKAITERYGKEYLSDSIRTYSGKVRNAQEAHEAIRPAGSAMKTKSELGLTGAEGKLYELIWKRTVASQMADAQLKFTTVRIEVGENEGKATFRASGKEVEFAGFFRAYVEGSDDPGAALDDQSIPLPKLVEGDEPSCKTLEPVGHETKPPARYTEASLIKVLEKEGVGRPSTYASIMDTIVRRGYVRKKGTQLVPTFTAFATINLLEQEFEQLVDPGFTAEMEKVLDEIATGEVEARPYLEKFYSGDSGLAKRVEQGLDKIDARAVSELSYPKWGAHKVRVGRYGPYVETEKDDEIVRASLPFDIAPADITEDQLDQLVEKALAGDDILGQHPEHDMPVLLKNGPYGPYVQLGPDDQEGRPKRMSIPKNMDVADVDFEVALQLLALPKKLGSHPETGNDIQVSIGRFGPYAQHGRVFASIPKAESILSIEFDRALELILKKEARSKALRQLGTHPETGDPVEIWEGRYGPYVKHQKTNASIPKEQDHEKVTLEEALDLIAAREATKGKKRSAKKRSTKKRSTKKRTTKKGATKKRTSKKSTTKKKATKKTSTKKASSKKASTKKTTKKSSG